MLHTGLAYVLMFAGMQSLDAGRIAVLQFVYPAGAILLDGMVYQHVLAPSQWLGVALMGVALWVAARR